MIRFSHFENSYVTKIDNLIKRKNNNHNHLLLAKFDTGASNTVISFDSIYGKSSAFINQSSIMTSAIDLLINHKNSVKRVEFKSASGHCMTGIPVWSEDVKIGNVTIPKFFYYLLINAGEKKALIGDDFISQGSFTHSKGGDIIMNSFDVDSYVKECAPLVDNAISAYELNDIILATEKSCKSNGETTSLNPEELMDRVVSLDNVPRKIDF